MKIDSAQLLVAYEATRAFSYDEKSAAENFRPVEDIFEDKKTKADASIMVYGVYNAGKSTLINALLGREAAATDDIPLTDRVSPYQWGQYSILDTPGVDAPIEHENVTRAQMLKADAIIFVVDPVGTVEEAKTLSVLMDLQQEGKQVFLVFNEKKPIGEEDFIKLKDQTRERLQQIAAERGIRDVLKSVPIVKINAKRALQGFLKEQPKLVELSGYHALEKQLTEFLQRISPDDIYGRLKYQLVAFLKDYVLILNARSKSEIVKNYDKILQSISTEKTKLRQNIERDFLRHKSNIYEKSKSSMRSAPEACQAKIEKLLESAGKQISERMNEELKIFVNDVQGEIEGLQAALPNIEHEGTPITVPDLGSVTDAGDHSNSFNNSSKIDPIQLKGAVDQIVALAKPEHIVGSLKTVKSVLPSLMKGIGAKTMEKWAVMTTAKWIPYVGVAVSAVSALYDLFSSDSEAEQLRQQTEEQQRAKERSLQQIDDSAREISDGFESSMRDVVQNELDTFFTDVITQVNCLKQGFSDAERDNSQRLERLLEIQQIAVTA